MKTERFSLFLDCTQNIDYVVLLLEMNEGNEVVSVNRILDYLIVMSETPSSLWVKGVSDVTIDSDL